MSKQSIKFYEELDALLRCEGLMLYDFGGGCTVVPVAAAGNTTYELSQCIAVLPENTTGFPVKILALRVPPFLSSSADTARIIIDNFDRLAILVETSRGLMPGPIDHATLQVEAKAT